MATVPKQFKIKSNQNQIKSNQSLLRAKVSRAVGFLKYAKTILHQEALSQIYRGIVEPHFRYCCSVWGSCGESRRLTLQKLQNRAARIVTNSSYDAPADALIQQLKWPNIAEIIKRETATIVYKYLNGLAISLKYLSKELITAHCQVEKLGD